MNMPQHNDNYFENRLTRLEITNETICATLARLEKRMDGLENKMDGIYSNLKYEIHEIRKDAKSDFRWIMTTVLVLSGSPIWMNILKSIHMIQ